VELFFGKIFLCLLAAAAVGFVMAWFWRRLNLLESEEAHHRTKQALTISQAELVRDAEAAKVELNRCRTELASAHEKLAANQQRIQSLTVDNENRLSQVASLSGSASGRESQIASLSASLSSSQQSLKERTNETQAANARILELEKQLVDLRQAVVEKASLANQLEGTLRQRDHSLATIQSRLENSDHIAHDLLKAKDDQLAAERRQSEQLLLANTAKIRDLQSQLASTPIDSERIQQMQYRIESLSAIEREFDGVRKTLTNRTQLLTEGQEQITRLKMDLERSNQARLQLENQVKELNAARQNLAAKLASVERIAHKLPRQFTSPPAHRDDIKHIYGVGPALEKLLNELGVYHFRQVATWSEADIDFFDSQLHEFHGRIRRENWVRSAIEEHYKKYGEWLGEGTPTITMPETNRV
jgi:predicted flap endonuclease-1-like 5' DNA nuclease